MTSSRACQLVVRQVDRRGGAAILAARVNRFRIQVTAQIFRERLARDRARRRLAELLLEPELDAVAYHRLGQRRRLDEEVPPEIRRRELAPRVGVETMRGNDVEHRELRDAIGVIEGHAMRHAAAAIVAGDGEGLEAKRRHDLHLVLRHRAL